MNYEPNTTHWPIRAKVIHDADAKERRILMTVVAYRTHGQCVTKYLEPDKLKTGRRNHYVNDIKVLHDPARFGIALEALTS